MPKISATNSKKLFIAYALKILLATVISVIVLNCIAAFIILKLDLDLSVSKYVTAAIVIISAGVISSVSITGFKNNYLLMSVISVVPLAIYVFSDFLVTNSASAYFFIKLIGIFLCAVIISLIKSAKKR